MEPQLVHLIRKLERPLGNSASPPAPRAKGKSLTLNFFASLTGHSRQYSQLNDNNMHLRHGECQAVHSHRRPDPWKCMLFIGEGRAMDH